MSREHKYRVWSEKLKKMVHFTLRELLVSYNNEDDYCHLADTDLFNISQDIDEDDVMEFTGCKDKNGKDGYSGDLVKMFGRSLFLVTWNDDYARYQLELVNGQEVKKIYDMGMLSMGEIVGNIHENPDLLKK